VSLNRLADEVWFKTCGKLRKVRPYDLHLLAVLSEGRTAPLHDKIVRAGDFQHGVNERTSLNAVLELPQPFRRGAMIESYTDDDGEIGDDTLLQFST
jgi:hypothetical protein